MDNEIEKELRYELEGILIEFLADLTCAEGEVAMELDSLQPLIDTILETVRRDR